MRKMVAITVTFSDCNGVELNSGGYCLRFLGFDNELWTMCLISCFMANLGEL